MPVNVRVALVLTLALLATPATDTLRRGMANLIYWFSVMGGGVFVIAAWFYWTALELAIPPKLHAHLHTLQPGYGPGFKWLPFTLAALYTAGWIALLLRLKKSRERPVIAWAATMTMIWGLLAILFVGWVDAGKSYRSMIADLQKTLHRNIDASPARTSASRSARCCTTSPTLSPTVAMIRRGSATAI